jgi:hypothetical protein
MIGDRFELFGVVFGAVADQRLDYWHRRLLLVVNRRGRLFDRRSHLLIAFAEPAAEQLVERRFVEIDFAELLKSELPFSRNVELGSQQLQGVLAQLKSQIARVL